jgi:hypothetical protein
MAHASNAAAKVARQSTARAQSVCVRMCVQVKGKNSGNNRVLGKGGMVRMDADTEAKSENCFTGNS